MACLVQLIQENVTSARLHSHQQQVIGLYDLNHVPVLPGCSWTVRDVQIVSADFIWYACVCVYTDT